MEVTLPSLPYDIHSRIIYYLPYLSDAQHLIDTCHSFKYLDEIMAIKRYNDRLANPVKFILDKDYKSLKNHIELNKLYYRWSQASVNVLIMYAIDIDCVYTIRLLHSIGVRFTENQINEILKNDVPNIKEFIKKLSPDDISNYVTNIHNFHYTNFLKNIVTYLEKIGIHIKLDKEMLNKQLKNKKFNLAKEIELNLFDK